jgi:hypothetical protein
MTLGYHHEEKYDIINIKVPRLSNAFGKVCFASNSQSDHVFLVNSFIDDSIINNSKRSIDDGNSLDSSSIPSNFISKCIVKIKKADHKKYLDF